MNCARDNDKLQKATALAVRVLNKLVDVNDYSTDAARLAGLEQRSLGIGIAGLQELALELDLPFTSREFLSVSNEVSELMYYAAVKESMLLAKEETLLLKDQVIRPEYHRKHPMIQETPLAKGVFHFELCGKKSEYVSQELWEELRKDILIYGIVNSLLIAHMPTASTSMLLACTEGSECLQELVQVRRTGSGEFLSINKYLQKDLEELGIWSKQLCEDIINKESLQNIDFESYYPLKNAWETSAAPKNKFIDRTNYLKTKYKTIWEISMKDYINLAAGRQPFIDQSQSMNLYYPEGILSKMISALVHGWKVGLKTGVYYTKVQKKTKADKKLSFNFVEKKEKPANSHYICDNCSV
jgi:ribonucleoside-diphosphate reductase alpha chain